MANSTITMKKICECCGKEFIAQKQSTRYCSHQCNSKAYKINKRIEAKRNVEAASQKIIIEKSVQDLKDKEYLSVIEVALLFGLCKQTIYNMIHSGKLKAVQITDRLSIIRKKDIEDMFDNASTYRARPKKIDEPITEFYTMAEIKEKYKVKEVWVYKIVKEKKIPKILRRGKSYFSKKHIDNYFAKKAPDTSITEWYSVEDIQNKYNLTVSAIYTFVSENQIPKKKEGRTVFYSQKHFDIAKGYKQPEEQQYYTVEEATAKFGISRDALYYYVKSHNISKIKEGRYVKLSKPELDNLFENPIIP